MEDNFNKTKFSLSGKFWIKTDGLSLLGRGKIELLEKIRDTGTLTKAASELEIPYRQAWNMVKSMNRDYCCPMVVLRHGGMDHGNAKVTGLGEKLIFEFRRIELDMKKFFEEQTAKMEFSGDSDGAPLVPEENCQRS